MRIIHTWVHYLMIFSLFALLSCGSGLLDDLSQSSADPVVVDPEVVSFQLEDTINISWNKDDCADSYKLERATASSATLDFSTVYQGTETSYIEKNCIDQSMFLYRLSKKRGSRYFGPSNSVLGVGSSVTQDAWEPNDTESAATNLDYEKSANLYYYRSYSGIELFDTDWYSIVVPPRMVSSIVVAQSGLSGTTTYMFFYQKGMNAQAITNNQTIDIKNYAYESQKFYFKIYPQSAFFIGSSGAAGGSLINYTVKLYSITAM